MIHGNSFARVKSGEEHARIAREYEIVYRLTMSLGKFRSALVGGLSVMTLTLWVMPPCRAETIGSVQFESSYAGAHPEAFAELLDETKVVVPGALAYITGQWNIPNTLHSPLLVRVIDVPTKDQARPMAAYVRSVAYGDQVRQVLVIDLPHHLLYPNENLDNVIDHEMAHVILRDAVTGPGSAPIPTWFNEGLAQSVTTEGTERTQEDFKRWGHSDARAVVCDLNGHVDEFLHGEQNFGCYTYFYLSVKRLIQLGGKDTIPQIISGLRGGTPLPDGIRRITSLDWPAFQHEAERYTLDVFAGNQPIP
jgi:hypothetical protein